jgi:hypothetical protein
MLVPMVSQEILTKRTGVAGLFGQETLTKTLLSRNKLASIDAHEESNISSNTCRVNPSHNNSGWDSIG